MERHAFAAKINEGKFNEFRMGLGRVWNSATRFMDDMEVRNFSLWNIEDLVFGYYENDLMSPKLDDAKKKELDGILSPMDGTFTWISSPAEEMRLMYHDFGIVRPNKELIRHRVFATQLKGDFQEEYKRRHDGLVEARGDAVDPGPDSNFSIWNVEPVFPSKVPSSRPFCAAAATAPR